MSTPTDLTVIERAIHVLDAAVTADEVAATIDPQGDHS